MPYEFEESGKLTREATVTVPHASYEREMKSALKELSSEVDLKGFRKGNVPLSVVRRKYGDRVQGDVIETLVREGLDEVIEDHGDEVLYIGQPEVTAIPDEEGGDLEFSVYLETRPDVDPIGYLGLEVDKPEPEVADEEVEEQLEQIRQNFASLEPIEFRDTIEEGDVVTFDFEPVDKTEELEDFVGEDVEVEIGSGRALPEIEEALEGAEMGATLTTTLTLDENYPDESLQGQEVELQMNVKSVKQRVLPELDDEFAKDTGEAETLLELRSIIRDSIHEQKEHRAEHTAEDNLVEALIAKHDVELPPKFVDQQVEREVQQRKQRFQQQGFDLEALGMDEDEFSEMTRGDVVRSIKSEFLLMAIAEQEGMDVDEEDLDRFFEHQAQHNQQVTAEQLKQYYQQDQQQWRNVQYQALMEKTKKWLLSEAEINEVEWEQAEEHHGVAGEGLAEDSSEAEGLAEDSSEAEGLAEDSSEVEGLDEDSSEAEGLDEDSSEVDED